MIYYPFYLLQDLIYQYFVRDLCVYTHGGLVDSFSFLVYRFIYLSERQNDKGQGEEGRARERHLSSICWVTPQCPQRPCQAPGKGHHVLHWLPPGTLARIQLGGMEHPAVQAGRPVKDERDPNSSLTAVLHCWPSRFFFL